MSSRSKPQLRSAPFWHDVSCCAYVCPVVVEVAQSPLGLQTGHQQSTQCGLTPQHRGMPWQCTKVKLFLA